MGVCSPERNEFYLPVGRLRIQVMDVEGKSVTQEIYVAASGPEIQSIIVKLM